MYSTHNTAFALKCITNINQINSDSAKINMWIDWLGLALASCLVCLQHDNNKGLIKRHRNHNQLPLLLFCRSPVQNGST